MTNTSPSNPSCSTNGKMSCARQEKTVVPVAEPDHRLTDDHNEEDVDNIHGEGFENGPGNFVNADNGNHNGPRLIKTVSYHLLSM